MPKKKNKGIQERREDFIVGAKIIQKVRRKYCRGFDVLGIDPSWNSTGISYRKKEEQLKIRTIVTETQGFSKVIYIGAKLRELFKDPFRPFAGLEGYAYNARFGREKAGELGGVIRKTLYFKKIPLLVISPLTVKAWVKAKKKEQIMLEILDRYKLKISDNDAADAFILQEITYRTLFLCRDIVKNKIKAADLLSYFKDEDFKIREKGLKDLYKYQVNSLFNLISNHGKEVLFFSKAPYPDNIKI